MRRVFVPALMAVALVALSSVNASAGLFDKLCGNSCDSCCDVEPTCGCEAPACCEPTCAAPAPCCEPTCAAPAPCCEPVDPCCDSCCSKPKFGGLLKKLFAGHGCGCDDGCCAEPTCGCEAPAACCEPTCAAPAPCCEPTCASEISAWICLVEIVLS